MQKFSYLSVYGQVENRRCEQERSLCDSDVFKVNNGINPENADGLDNDHDAKIEDKSGQYKKR